METGCLHATQSAWPHKFLKRIFLAGLLASFIAGCAPASMKLGVEPSVDRLDTLQLGSSDKAAVRETLGEPQGAVLGMIARDRSSSLRRARVR